MPIEFKNINGEGNFTLVNNTNNGSFVLVNSGGLMPTPSPTQAPTTAAPTASPTAAPTTAAPTAAPTPPPTTSPTPAPTSASPLVTSGLVFNLQSAPTSGSTWTDATGNGYNATLQGSSSYTGSFGGGMLERIYGKNDYPKNNWHFNGEQSYNFFNEFIKPNILIKNGLI